MAVPCVNADAVSAAKGLFKTFLFHRVMPEAISSDRGTHFTSEVTKKFCEIMGIRQELHVPWRPQSSGTVERAHRTLKSALFILMQQRGEAWPNLLDEVVSNMNCLENKSTKVSPHFVCFGRHPSLRLPQLDKDLVHNDQTAYGMLLHQRIKDIGRATKIAAEEADLALENRLNKGESPQLDIGDNVLLYRPQSAEAKSSHLPWIPGYTVTNTNGMVIQVERDGKSEWVHRFHVRVIPDRPRRFENTTPMPNISTHHREETEPVDTDLPLDWSDHPDSTVAGKETSLPIPNPIDTVPEPVPESVDAVPEVNVSNTTARRRRSKIPVRIRKEPSRFRDYIRY